MSDFKFEAWPTEYRSINQYFGANPQNYAQFGLPGHEGVDIMAPTGSRIFAVAPGIVRFIFADATGHNYGIHVRIDHRDNYQTIYAHLKEVRVRVGDTVQAGTLLGLADNTGNSFGSHLHLTLKHRGTTFQNYPGNIIDPTPFLLPLLGWQEPAGPYTAGWAFTAGIITMGNLAQATSGGINLRDQPSVNARLIDLVPGGTIMIVTGPPRSLYTPVKVATATLKNVPQPSPPPPTPPPATGEATVDGWGFASYLTRNGNQAVVGQVGINLRARPERSATNIGLVRGGSTVTITGPQSGEYLPVRVRRSDFSGPINITTPAPAPPQPAPGPAPADAIIGWAFTQNLTINGAQAISGRFGTNLRSRPSRTAPNVGLFKEGATAIVVGLSRGEYTPVLARRSDVGNIAIPIPTVEQPDPLPGGTPPPPPEPIPDTTPGWAFSSQITVAGGMAIAGQYGINLRDAPRRDATNLGFVPASASMIVTGMAQGEYTPVRVDDRVLQKPFTPGQVVNTTVPPPAPDPEPTPLGQARIGLHASADPGITQAEVDEFALMRPGMIKLLSFHDPAGVQKLAAAHPNAGWILRAFLDFGGRNIRPEQFFNDTISDVKRTLSFLQGKDVVVELHNEPNLVAEGLGASWSDGASFAHWWLELLRLYRQALPGTRFIYPGLSPGAAVGNVKQDHIQFIEASRQAVDAADGLGLHLYWSNVFPMEAALAMLDDAISRFRFKPIWVTEASNNKAGTPAFRKAQQYLQFWHELQKRPTVQGVTYFVASASNPVFREEIWIGREIARRIGRR